MSNTAADGSAVRSVGLDALNRMGSGELRQLLLDACHLPVGGLADTIVEGRPYPDEAALVARAEQRAQELSDDEVRQALRSLTRIGRRLQGEGREARWSRQETSRMQRDEETSAKLVAGNVAYEERFDQVFLISATGLTAQDILDAMHRRLGHTREQENAEIKSELRKLLCARLPKLLSELGEDQPAR